MTRHFTALVVGLLVLTAASASRAALVSTNMTLVQSGGTFDVGNIALGKTAFAPNIEGQDGGTPTQPTGYGGVHTTTGVNNGVYGNTGAWLAGSAGSFVGLDLGGSFNLSSIAYGRDNNGGFGDRQLGLVTLQFTQVVSPGVGTAATGNAATGWQTIGTTDYTGAGIDFSQADRHRFNFAPVTATGIRLVTATSGRGIDEIELYSAPFLGIPLAGGTSVIQDETTNSTGFNFTGPAIAEPPPGDDFYHGVFNGNGASMTWTPGLLATNVTVEASWGVSFNHSRDVDYFFDPDGAGPQPEIALAQNVGQHLFADQTTALPSGQAWSGFFTIGSGLNLTVDSTFRFTGTAAVGGVFPEALMSGVWRFTAVVPEPASASLAMFGLAGLAMRRRRTA